MSNVASKQRSAQADVLSRATEATTILSAAHGDAPEERTTLLGNLVKRATITAKTLQSVPGSSTGNLIGDLVYGKILGGYLDRRMNQRPEWFNPSPGPAKPYEVFDERNDAIPSSGNAPALRVPKVLPRSARG